MTDQDFDFLLGQIGAGHSASHELMESLYTELRTMATRIMNNERGSHTLQPTALVHEAFLRLVDAKEAGEKGHLYFLDAAAVTMRRVLVDHARAHLAEKRGGNELRKRVTLRGVPDESESMFESEDVDLATLDEALLELTELNPRHAKMVELRFFGGMSGDQIAEHLNISRSTVTRDITLSRAWLQRRMKRETS